MTNKEWMATLTSEQFYDVMEWLMRKYSKQWTNSQVAIIEWLDEKHKGEEDTFKLFGEQEGFTEDERIFYKKVLKQRSTPVGKNVFEMFD